MKKVLSVKDYLQSSKWKDLLTPIRNHLLETALKEEVKWGTPHYTLDKKIVIGLAGFNNHCAIWFHQGVFLKDPKNVLINAQKGKTKGLRQWRFTNEKDLDLPAIQEYIDEAIENQRKGLVVKPEKKKVSLPQELKQAFETDVALKKAFETLSPSKQKEYKEHIASAKQAKTRINRLLKAIPLIEKGKGLNDKYK